MINFDDYTNENIIEHNSKWPYIPDHSYRILIIGSSGSGKTNALDLIKNQLDIDKIYLYAKDPYEAKYQYLIKKREKVGLDHFDDPKAFIEYSNDMQDVYKNIEDYNLEKERKILIVIENIDDMIADIINNKKLNPIVTELFIRGRKLNISIVFIMQSYFKVPKDVRLNLTHFFIMKILNKRELQQIALNHSSDIDFKDFMKIYKKCTKEPYSFLVNDTTLFLVNIIIEIMTIDDQIKDEKLQYDINREAAKISALSSGKFNKYEYLTGEEILPSNKQQIIEQTKFTYSPLGKAFEKETKTIEDQGKKQTEALENLKLNERTRDKAKPIEYNNYFINKLAKIQKSIEPVDFDNLIYYYEGSNEPINFSEYNGMMNIFKSIHSGDKILEDI